MLAHGSRARVAPRPRAEAAPRIFALIGPTQHDVREVMVDGPHAQPKYIATMEYGLTGKMLKLKGKPARKNA